ncbi:MAG: FAD-dependent oxidoreductase [Spirochaeta sp.]|jgi:thioredoxin reductase (NADPH)|nr:FAD-dependent oxidoreductase [Spirochaeta sp.]
MKPYDAIIIGAGPAGLAAGMYMARARQRVVILDQGTVGGQVLLTHAVANYPGMPELSGYELVGTMRKQAEEFGCDIVSNTTIDQIDLRPETKTVATAKETYQAGVVILAMGGTPRSLGLPSEERLKGRGISYCATCDGDFFTDHDIIVVGGGNSALEEAVSLTTYARSVTIVHQFDHFQGYPHAILEAEENPKISFMMESVVEEFLGQDELTGARIRHTPTGENTTIDATGAFIFIGYAPNTQLVDKADCVILNERNEIVADESMATSVAGVYVAGDARQKQYRQITTAVGDGTVAALAAMQYITSAHNRADTVAATH